MFHVKPSFFLFLFLNLFLWEELQSLSKSDCDVWQKRAPKLKATPSAKLQRYARVDNRKTAKHPCCWTHAGREGASRGKGRGRGSLEKESPSRTRCQQYNAKNSDISILFWLGADTQWPAVKANTLERLDEDSARVDPDCLLLWSDSLCKVLTRKTVPISKRILFSFRCTMSLILNARRKRASLTQMDHNGPRQTESSRPRPSRLEADRRFTLWLQELWLASTDASSSSVTQIN